MMSILLEKDVFKVLGLFSISPGSRFNRKEIKEKTLLNNTPLDKALLKLVRSQILKREGRLYSINFNFPYAKTIISLLSEEYRRFKEIPFQIFLIVNEVAFDLSLWDAEAFLFGSYSKLVYREDSDIDIAVLVGKNMNKKIFEGKIRKKEKLYKKKIEIHYFNVKEFYKNKSDPLVAEILKNGIKIG